MIELRRDKSRVRLTPTVWMLTLELARICGWSPEGTRVLTVADGSSVDALKDVRHLMGWQTEYLSNDGQMVTAPDASLLSEALTKASRQAEQILSQWAAGQLSTPADVRNTPPGFRWFITPDGKTHLKNLAEFCRGGSFQIF